MRYNRKRDTCMFFLLAYALTVLPGCAGDLAQTVGPSGPIAAVTVSVDSNTLLVGHSAHALAIARDTAGNRLDAQTVSWKSLTPTIASVSSDGVVTAVTSGSALIQGTISGTTGLDTMVVVVPPNIRSHNFNDGTLGALVNPWDVGVDFPDDPTRSGHGKVARILYDPAQAVAQSSEERGFGYQSGADHVRYGRTIWFRGEVYLPSAGSTLKANHNRKLLDFLGTGPNGSPAGMVVHRRDMMLYLSCMDWMNGSLQETVFESTGITLADDTWYTIEVRMTTNSADNVRDGVLEIYMNGASTPTYSRTTGIGWITEVYPGGTYFNWFGVGYQLTVDAGDPVYTEYRYWDNVAFSTTRIGR